MIQSDPFEDKDFKAMVERSIEGITDSSTFLAIFTKNYTKDIKAIMQLGLAVVMNKPIFLLVPKSYEPQICDNVKRLARAIEYVDDINDGDSVKAAGVRLMNKAKAAGFI